MRHYLNWGLTQLHLTQALILITFVALKCYYPTQKPFVKMWLKVLHKRKIKTRTEGQLSCQNEEPDNSSNNWGLEVQRLKTKESYHMLPSNHKNN